MSPSGKGCGGCCKHEAEAGRMHQDQGTEDCSECEDGFMFERNMVKHNEKHKKMKELLFIHEKEKVPNHGKKVDENEARKQLSIK